MNIHQDIIFEIPIPRCYSTNLCHVNCFSDN